MHRDSVFWGRWGGASLLIFYATSPCTSWKDRSSKMFALAPHLSETHAFSCALRTSISFPSVLSFFFFFKGGLRLLEVSNLKRTYHFQRQLLASLYVFTWFPHGTNCEVLIGRRTYSQRESRRGQPIKRGLRVWRLCYRERGFMGYVGSLEAVIETFYRLFFYWQVYRNYLYNKSIRIFFLIKWICRLQSQIYMWCGIQPKWGHIYHANAGLHEAFMPVAHL